jgi:hypothetical protein
MAEHFHIRWSGSKPLDWECFSTLYEAEASATNFARPGESYSIETFDETCIRCKLPTEDSLREVLDVIVARGSADFGTMQVLDRSQGGLRIVAQRGFSTRFLRYFDFIREDTTACSRAILSGAPVLVRDVATDPCYDDGARATLLEDAVRACCSLPLLTSGGDLVGVVSVHYRSPRPDLRAHLEAEYARDVADHLFDFARLRSRSNGPPRANC